MDALVLGGGGVVGIAWELGVLAGLAERGALEPRSVSTIVGTSAGSFVGALIAAGADLRELAARHDDPGPDGAGLEPDVEALMDIFALWTSSEAMTPALAASIGARALAARTMPEDRWVARIEEVLGSGASWPDRDLRITAVDCATGERVVFTAASGAPLAHAVAASCCVPGLFPPVSIGSSRYMDGGVWSGSNADVVAGQGFERVLFAGPLSASAALGPTAGRSLEQEVALLRSEGVAATVVVPGAEFAPLGANLMDTSRRSEALEIGLRDGRRVPAGTRRS